MSFFDKKRDFIKIKNFTIPISILFFIASMALICFKGFVVGIDFKGGVVTEVGYKNDVTTEYVTQHLEKDFKELTVVHHGNSKNVVIQTSLSDGGKGTSKKIISLLQNNENPVHLVRSEFIGPKIGDELKTNGIIALSLVLLGILIYISIRFESKFAFGAVLATLHDLIITIGFISLLGIKLDLNVLAALLALLGYSLNDTIIVFDRIRENIENIPEKSISDILNISINETLSRTIMTSFTTSVTLISLLLFGGAELFSFSAILLFGIVIGTYSSIYVASLFLLMFKIDKNMFKKDKIDTKSGVI